MCRPIEWKYFQKPSFPGDDPILQPFTFVLPGYQPDVSLNVFGKEVHAHSIILKLHSAYFRKFMDMPNPPKQSMGSYLYNYVTVVDDDRLWGLEKIGSPAQDAAQRFEGDMDESDQSDTDGNQDKKYRKEKRSWERRERHAFLKLLMAMYNRPYYVENHYDILDLVRLADFYAALPILSSSLTVALTESQPIEYGHINLLKAARQVRNRALYHDCILHMVSRWIKLAGTPDEPEAVLFRLVPRLEEFCKEEPQLFGLVKKSYNSVLKRVHLVEDKVVERFLFRRWDSPRGLPSALMGLEITAPVDSSDRFDFYLRLRLECFRKQEGSEDLPRNSYEKYEYRRIVAATDPLAENHLVFRYALGPGAGNDPTHIEDPLHDCFCTEVWDYDLPWDSNQIDW